MIPCLLQSPDLITMRDSKPEFADQGDGVWRCYGSKHLAPVIRPAVEMPSREADPELLQERRVPLVAGGAEQLLREPSDVLRDVVSFPDYAVDRQCRVPRSFLVGFVKPVHGFTAWTLAGGYIMGKPGGPETVLSVPCSGPGRAPFRPLKGVGFRAEPAPRWQGTPPFLACGTGGLGRGIRWGVPHGSRAPCGRRGPTGFWPRSSPAPTGRPRQVSLPGAHEPGHHRPPTALGSSRLELPGRRTAGSGAGAGRFPCG